MNDKVGRIATVNIMPPHKKRIIEHLMPKEEFYRVFGLDIRAQVDYDVVIEMPY